jgi:sporulation protein YlmC with PRC-barrel domain
MTRKLVSYVLSILLGALLASTAVGQSDQQKQGQQSDKAASGATRQAAPVGAVPLGVTVEAQALVLEGWRASKLIGANVYNEQNQRIGKIEDMLVSPDGKLSVAVIDVGGFLGIGKHRVAIPVDQFSDITAKRLVLPGATKEALKGLPEFRYT